MICDHESRFSVDKQENNESNGLYVMWSVAMVTLISVIKQKDRDERFDKRRRKTHSFLLKQFLIWMFSLCLHTRNFSV